MAIFFDGHNDSLTKPDHDRFVGGRDGGHLDLPRMAAAGMRGGIFAVFIRNPETADYRPAQSKRPGGAGPAPELDHAFAAGASTTAKKTTGKTIDGVSGELIEEGSKISSERAFADFIFGSLILHGFCVNFIN